MNRDHAQSNENSNNQPVRRCEKITELLIERSLVDIGHGSDLV